MNDIPPEQRDAIIKHFEERFAVDALKVLVKQYTRLWRAEMERFLTDYVPAPMPPEALAQFLDERMAKAFEEAQRELKAEVARS